MRIASLMRLYRFLCASIFRFIRSLLEFSLFVISEFHMLFIIYKDKTKLFM